MTTKLSRGDDLCSYTWDHLLEDLKARGLFADNLSHLISVTQNEAISRIRYLGKRQTESNIERFAEDERARFALNVLTLRQEQVALTPDDVLSRPAHWLAAWAIAGKLGNLAP